MSEEETGGFAVPQNNTNNDKNDNIVFKDNSDDEGASINIPEDDDNFGYSPDNFLEHIKKQKEYEEKLFSKPPEPPLNIEEEMKKINENFAKYHSVEDKSKQDDKKDKEYKSTKTETPKSFVESYFPPDIYDISIVDLTITKKIKIVGSTIINKDDYTKRKSIWFIWDSVDNRVIYSDLTGFEYLQPVTERNKVKSLIEKYCPELKENIKAILLEKAILVAKEYPSFVTEFEKLEDIQVSYDDAVAPMNFDGLPEYNIMKQLMSYIDNYTYAYKEFSWQNGLALMSTLARRRIRFFLDGKDFYTNNITIVLGGSGTAKTPPFELTEKIARKAMGNVFLSVPGSIQGMKEKMADYIYTNKRNEDGTFSRVTSYDWSEYYEIRRALCSLWMDEGGSFFSMLGQNFSDTEIDYLNWLFSGSENKYEKDLVGKFIEIGPAYFSSNLATTISRYVEFISTKLSNLGFFPRQLVVAPTYELELRKHTMKRVLGDNGDAMLVEQIKIIDSMLPDEPINIVFSPECEELYQNWSLERQAYFMKERDDIMGGFISKFNSAVLKVAILIELANVPYYIADYVSKQSDTDKLNEKIIINYSDIIRKIELPYTRTDAEKNIYRYTEFLLNNNNICKNFYISDISVSVNSMKFALKLFDDMYMRYHHVLFASVREPKNPNYMLYVYNKVKEKRKVSRSHILTTIGGKAKDLEEAIDALRSEHLVTVNKVWSSKKPETIYVYNPPANVNYKFKSVELDGSQSEAVITLSRRTQNPNESTEKDATKKRKKSETEASVSAILEAFKTMSEKTDVKAQPNKNQKEQLLLQVSSNLSLNRVKYKAEDLKLAEMMFYQLKDWTLYPDD